jgi:glucose/arabinose dehydrogenase
MSRLAVVLCCLAVAACDRKSPAPPVVTPPAGAETINGTERIGWDQRAADTAELATISYAIYVDGTRTPLTAVTCATQATAAGFACSARLPALPAGSHTLQIASFVADGTVLESDRSASLSVSVVPQINVSLPPPGTTAARPPRVWDGTRVDLPDRVTLRVELVAEGFEETADLAFAPDGRLFVADRAGTIHILPPQSVRTSAPDPALSLAEESPHGGAPILAIAVDPEFGRTHFAFAIYTAASRAGGRMFRLARFRESSNTLGDRIVLLDGIPADAPSPAAALRFGGDGKLYAAFDDGGDPRRSRDGASLNGKMLRLNPDGTTPDDQAGSTPVYAEGFRSPVGFDWDPRHTPGPLWVADREAGASTLRRVVADTAARAGRTRGVVDNAYTLPAASAPASVVFYRGGLIPVMAGSLLVASDEGRHLLRISGDRVDTLLQDQVGGIRAVTIAPDGAIYFANASAVGRLLPDRR